MRNKPEPIRLICVLIGLMAVSVSWGQPGAEALEERYRSFFSGGREAIHLHLNKTHFFKGEHIWYTVYAYDLNGRVPAKNALNAFVGIYNREGEELLRETVYLEEGVGHSQIRIDSAWTDSLYLIRAGSLRSNAFPAQGNYEQQIRILQESIPRRSAGENTDPVLEVTPEGGPFLIGMRNSAVVRLSGIPNFEFERTELWLSDASGKRVVSQIPLNAKGFGRLEFRWDQGQRYILHALLYNGDELQYTLPQAEVSGVGLRLNVLNPEYIFMSIEISPRFNEEQGPLYWALHQGPHMEIQLLDESEGKVQKRLDRADLQGGLNAITILDAKYQPLAQRLFYNANGAFEASSSIEASLSRAADPDSLQIEFSLKFPAIVTASISVLPADTQAYTPQHNAVSAFAFRPYLSEAFEAGEVRHTKDRRGLFDLDLFMMNHGAGAYDWKTIPSTPSTLPTSEDVLLGYKGRVADADLKQENQVWAVTDTGKDAFVIPLGRDKTFEGQAAFYRGDTLRLSLMGKKGRLDQGSVELNWELPKGWHDPIEPADRLLPLPNRSRGYSGAVLDFSREALSSEDPRLIALEEVEITAEKASRYIPINSAEISGKSIGESEIKRIPSLAEYLRRQGFKPRWVEGQLVVLSRTMKPGPVPSYVPVPVYLNGMIADGSTLNIPLSNVAGVFYDNLGREFISVVLRTQNFFIENRERYSNFEVSQGYAQPMAFRNPLSWNALSDAFESFGQIHWVPKLRLNPNKTVRVVFPDEGYRELLLFVEGLSEDGRLISRTFLLSLPSD